MWKAHGIWIALWWLWNDSSHRSCVWRMKIINYKSPSYLIPLERELEASVVPFALLCFSLLRYLLFSLRSPPFLLPHTRLAIFFSDSFFFLLCPHTLFSSFLFHYKLHFYLLILSLNYSFIFTRPLHVMESSENRIESSSPEVLDSAGGAVVFSSTSSCVPASDLMLRWSYLSRQAVPLTRALYPSLHAKHQTLSQQEVPLSAWKPAWSVLCLILSATEGQQQKSDTLLSAEEPSWSKIYQFILIM